MNSLHKKSMKRRGSAFLRRLFVGFDRWNARLRQRLDALGPAPRAGLLHVLMLPDFERAARIGEFWSYPQSRSFAELPIDGEEDRTLRAGARRDAPRGRPGALGVSGTGAAR
jgi:hypothetical protein